MTSASASGKVILLGEHAVVYGRPALAVPVTQVRAQVEVTDSNRPGIWIEAPDIDLHTSLTDLPQDHPIAAVIRNTLDQIRPPALPPMEIHFRSQPGWAPVQPYRSRRYAPWLDIYIVPSVMKRSQSWLMKLKYSTTVHLQGSITPSLLMPCLFII